MYVTNLTIAVVTNHSPAINTAGALEILTQTWQRAHVVHAHIPHENPKLDIENRMDLFMLRLCQCVTSASRLLAACVSV